MKRVLVVVLGCALHACSQLPVSSEPLDPTVGDEAAIGGSDEEVVTAASPQDSDLERPRLLLLRQQYCLEPKAQRRAKIERYGSRIDTQSQLDRLLLMSCELAAFSSSIPAAVTQIRNAQEWSSEDLAFFAFLKESTDALRAAEAKRYALQVQLEDTIQGITHIEEAIDSRGGDHRLAEE